MESYLKYTLGLHVSIRTWNDSNTLPDELKREKEYSLLEICGITCLIITVREVDFQLSVFERKCEELHKYVISTEMSDRKWTIFCCSQ